MGASNVRGGVGSNEAIAVLLLLLATHAVLIADGHSGLPDAVTRATTWNTFTGDLDLLHDGEVPAANPNARPFLWEGGGILVFEWQEALVLDKLRIYIGEIGNNYLARAYLQVNQVDKAVSKCEELFRQNPMTKKDLGLQSVYWEALLKKGDKAKLKRALDVAIRDGSRPTQAAALVKRGDLIAQDNNKTRDSLIDGYLRVIIFYQAEKSAYEEALFKAAAAHTVLNEHHYAEKWRAKLRSQFPRGKWTARLTS